MEPNRPPIPEEAKVSSSTKPVLDSFAASIAEIRDRFSAPSLQPQEARAASSATSSRNTPKHPSRRFFSTLEELKAAYAAEDCRGAEESRAAASAGATQPPSKPIILLSEEARAAEEARSLEKPPQSPSKHFLASEGLDAAARATASASSPKKTHKRPSSSVQELEAPCAAEEVRHSASLQPSSKRSLSSAEETLPAVSTGSPKEIPKPSPKRTFSSVEESPIAALARSPKKTPKPSPPSTALASFPRPEQPVHQFFSSTITDPAPTSVLRPIPEVSAAVSCRSTPFQQWPQPSSHSTELPQCATQSGFRPQPPIPPIPTLPFHIPAQPSPQIPTFSCFPYPPLPVYPSLRSPAILWKKDGSPADYGTKFSDLCDESQASLLQIEMRIQEYREESKQLDQCSRLPTNHFELQSKRIFQETGEILLSVEKLTIPIQQMLDSVVTMMRDVETAVQSWKQLYLDRNFAATHGVPRFYGGIPTKPSPYMQQTVTRFGTELTKLLRCIEEIQETLKVPSSRDWSLESIPDTMSNLHQAFLQISAKVEDIHQSLEVYKRVYLADQHRKGNTANPFLEADRQEAAQQRTAARRFHPTS